MPAQDPKNKGWDVLIRKINKNTGKETSKDLIARNYRIVNHWLILKIKLFDHTINFITIPLPISICLFEFTMVKKVLLSGLQTITMSQMGKEMS